MVPYELAETCVKTLDRRLCFSLVPWVVLLVSCSSRTNEVARDGELVAQLALLYPSQGGAASADSGTEERHGLTFFFDPESCPVIALHDPLLQETIGRAFFRTAFLTNEISLQKVNAVVSWDGGNNDDLLVCVSIEARAPSTVFLEQFNGLLIGVADRQRSFTESVARVLAHTMLAGHVGEVGQSGKGVFFAHIMAESQHWRTLEIVFDNEGVSRGIDLFNPQPHPSRFHGGERCRNCVD